MKDVRVSQGLGLLTAALGVLQIVAPRKLARLLKADDPETLRARGAEQLASGVAALRHPERAAGLWGRLAGNMGRVALLVAALLRKSPKWRVAAAIGAAIGFETLDVLVTRRLQAKKSSPSARVLRVIQAGREVLDRKAARLSLHS